MPHYKQDSFLKSIREVFPDAEIVPDSSAPQLHELLAFITASMSPDIKFPLPQNGNWEFYWDYFDQETQTEETNALEVLRQGVDWHCVSENRQLSAFLVKIPNHSDFNEVKYTLLSDVYFVHQSRKTIVAFTHELQFGPYVIELGQIGGSNELGRNEF